MPDLPDPPALLESLTSRVVGERDDVETVKGGRLLYFRRAAVTRSMK
jgi:hypothetical protein